MIWRTELAQFGDCKRIVGESRERSLKSAYLRGEEQRRKEGLERVRKRAEREAVAAYPEADGGDARARTAQPSRSSIFGGPRGTRAHGGTERVATARTSIYGKQLSQLATFSTRHSLRHHLHAYAAALLFV